MSDEQLRTIKRKMRSSRGKKWSSKRKVTEKRREQIRLYNERKKELEHEKKLKLEKKAARQRQILRVKPIVELEDRSKLENNTETIQKPFVQRTIVRIINPNEEKNLLSAMNSEGQLPSSNQSSKKFYIIRKPNQLIQNNVFTLPENLNREKFVIKKIQDGEIKSKVQGNSNENLIKEIRPTSKFQILKPLTKIGAIHPQTKLVVPSKEIVRKELILWEEFRDTETPEPQMQQDPIDISDSILPKVGNTTEQKSTDSKENILVIDGLVSTSNFQVPSTSKKQISKSSPVKSDRTLSSSHEYLELLDNMIFANLDKESRGEITQDGKKYKTSELTPNVILQVNDDVENLPLNENYPCDHCNCEFNSYTDLVKHWIKLKNICEICDVVFPFPFLLQMHMQDVHNIKGYKCTSCNYFHSNLWNLKIHRLRGHCQEYRYPCENCVRAFNTSESLQLHMEQDHHQTTSTVPGVLCDFCGREFMNYYTLECHINYSHSQKKYTCKQCDKILETRATYCRHLQTHRMKKIVCEQCGKKFDIQSDLKSHMRQHTGEKPYKCSICSKSFAKSNTLRQHLLIHTGKRPYVCDICGKSFTQKPGLTAHRKSHPGDLPHMPCVFINEILSELPNDAYQYVEENSETTENANEPENQEADNQEVDDPEEKQESNQELNQELNKESNQELNRKVIKELNKNLEKSVIEQIENKNVITETVETIEIVEIVESQINSMENFQSEQSGGNQIIDANTIEANVMEIVTNEANILDIVENEANILQMNTSEENILKMVENDDNNILEDILENTENGNQRENCGGKNLDTGYTIEEMELNLHEEEIAESTMEKETISAVPKRRQRRRKRLERKKYDKKR